MKVIVENKTTIIIHKLRWNTDLLDLLDLVQYVNWRLQKISCTYLYMTTTVSLKGKNSYIEIIRNAERKSSYFAEAISFNKSWTLRNKSETSDNKKLNSRFFFVGNFVSETQISRFRLTHQIWLFSINFQRPDNNDRILLHLL